MSASLHGADAETRADSSDHHALRLWLRLYACTHLIEKRVRRRLQGKFGMTLPRFDFMAQLDRAPQGLRMSELSDRLMVTGGNVTGLTDTLEREGLVVRDPDETDRRALRVKLTREGRKVFRAVAVEHEGWVIDMFKGLSDEEAAALGEQLITLKNHVLENVPVEAVREHKS